MPSDVDNYFADTEPAVRHLFEALHEYDALTVPPSLGKYADDRVVVIMNREQALGYMQELSGSLALDFAKATLCGSIAQVAYMALKQYSTNDTIDDDCARFNVAQGSKVAKFCVGRRVHGIPVG